MADNEKKCCVYFSSPAYTNILLTIIAVLLIAGVVCKHFSMGKRHSCVKGDKGMMSEKAAMECPMAGAQTPVAK